MAEERKPMRLRPMIVPGTAADPCDWVLIIDRASESFSARVTTDALADVADLFGAKACVVFTEEVEVGPAG